MSAHRMRVSQAHGVWAVLTKRIFSDEGYAVGKGALVSSARNLATAKGKKVIPVKKPAAKKSNSGKAKKSVGTAEETANVPSQRFNSLLDSALDAPSPVRHLKAKEKLRELEREKLGLVSKDKQKLLGAEKDMEKARVKAEKKNKGQKGKSNATETEIRDGEEEVIPVKLDAANASVELTAEEAKRLAKAYSRYMMQAERARAAAETVRLQLKKEAIEALPLHLQAAARVPDLTPFPLRRVPASLSPPLGGYVEELALNAQRAASVRKSR